MSRQSWIGETRAPHWAKELLREVTSRESAGQIPPRLGFFKSPNGDYGGRWFPHENAIGIYVVDNDRLEKVVLLHELGHYLESFKGNFPGRHDAGFYRRASYLYTAYGADPSVVCAVERRIKWKA